MCTYAEEPGCLNLFSNLFFLSVSATYLYEFMLKGVVTLVFCKLMFLLAIYPYLVMLLTEFYN